MKTIGTLLLVAAHLLVASDAAAEVSDKIPPKALVLVWPFICLIVTALAWSCRRVVGLLATVLVALPTVALLSELADPFVGPAILDEQGIVYVAAAFAPIGGIILGIIYGIQRRGRRAPLRDFDQREDHRGVAL